MRDFRYMRQEDADRFGANPEMIHSSGWRRSVATAWLYHTDSSICLDRWSCQEQDHTSVPPRCGAQTADRLVGCELPKGHPGPHVPAADRKYRATGNGGNVGRKVTDTTGRQGHSAAPL